MNTCKAFPGLDDMACSNPWHDLLQFLPEHWQAKKYWISWHLQTPNLLEKILITAGRIISLKLKTKKTKVQVCGITNTNMKQIYYLLVLLILLEGANHEKSSQNN